MKNLFFTLLIFSTLSISAQTTHDISWTTGAGPADLTIDVGDTVRWTWDDALPHSVTSLPGSTETFDSGIISGMGTQFSHTFTMEGTNDYQCDVHSGSMFGTITVEAVLGVADNNLADLALYPNPVSDVLNLSTSGTLESYDIYTITGQRVDGGALSQSFVQVSNLSRGLYFIEVSNEFGTKTIKFVKR